MATFGELQDRVRSYLIDVSTATAAQVPNFVNDAIRQGERRHNFRHMQALLAINTVAATRLLASFPATWKESRSRPFYKENRGTTIRIDWLESEEQSIVQFDDDPLQIGPPEKILEKNASLELEVYPYSDGRSDWPDTQYRLFLPYWAKSPDLVLAGDTNWWTTHAADYVTWHATGMGQFFNESEEAAGKWVALAEAQFVQLRVEDKRARIPDDLILQPRTDVYGSTDQGWRGGDPGPWPGYF